MSNTIDYQAEVKKVYNSAFAWLSKDLLQFSIFYTDGQILASGSTQEEAWATAYKALKQQDKI